MKDLQKRIEALGELIEMASEYIYKNREADVQKWWRWIEDIRIVEELANDLAGYDPNEESEDASGQD